MARAPVHDLESARARILASDLRRSWAFYRDALGLEPVRGHGEPPYGEVTAAGGALVSVFDRTHMAAAVGLRPGRYEPRATGGSARIYGTGDVDAVARRLRRHRIRLLQGPTDRPAGRLRTIHLREPDGRLIEIYSETPPIPERPARSARTRQTGRGSPPGRAGGTRP